jgi:hypothetical protein
MPQCWGWSPAHAAYVGCRRRTAAEGHCADCRARCGYKLDTLVSAGAQRSRSASSYQAIAPMGAELLLGVGGAPPGEYGAVAANDRAGADEVHARRASSGPGSGPEAEAAESSSGALLSQLELAQLAAAAAKALGLESGGDGCTFGSEYTVEAKRDAGASAGRDSAGCRGDAGASSHCTAASPEPVSPVSEAAHPWLLSSVIGGCGPRDGTEELGDVVAQFCDKKNRSAADLQHTADVAFRSSLGMSTAGRCDTTMPEPLGSSSSSSSSSSRWATPSSAVMATEKLLGVTAAG